jgi:hypothetical protein
MDVRWRSSSVEEPGQWHTHVTTEVVTVHVREFFLAWILPYLIGICAVLRHDRELL